jgi:hypothetical protein
MSRSAEALGLAAVALVLSPGPLAARDRDEPAANRTPDAGDVAMTPITDLNLAKDDIPSALLAAQAAPYASVGIRSCDDIAAAIAPLDAALGPDMDVNEGDNDRVSPGAVAKSVVASFIPFRGILRELSGAAEHQRAFQAAIYAGAVRRGYLKGLGEQKGCPYPARPAFARVVVKTSKNAAPAAPTAGEPAGFVSEPVVQQVPGPQTVQPRSKRR